MGEFAWSQVCESVESMDIANNVSSSHTLDVEKNLVHRRTVHFHIKEGETRSAIVKLGLFLRCEQVPRPAISLYEVVFRRVSTQQIG